MNLLTLMKRGGKGVEFAFEDVLPTPSIVSDLKKKGVEASASGDLAGDHVSANGNFSSVNVLSSDDEENGLISELIRKRKVGISANPRPGGVPSFRHRLSSASKRIRGDDRGPSIAVSSPLSTPGVPVTPSEIVFSGLNLGPVRGSNDALLDDEARMADSFGSPLTGLVSSPTTDPGLNAVNSFPVNGVSKGKTTVYDPMLSDDARSEVFAPAWCLTRGSLVDTPVSACEFMTHVLPDATRLRNQSLDTRSISDHFCLNAFNAFRDGIEVHFRMVEFERENAGLSGELSKLRGELSVQQGVNADLLKSLETSQKMASSLQASHVTITRSFSEKEAELKRLQENVAHVETTLMEKENMWEEEKVWLEDALKVAYADVDHVQREISFADADLQCLARDKHWLISQGFLRVFNRIKGSGEYLKLLGDAYNSCLAAGYQNGLKDGYKYHASGLPLEGTKNYLPRATAWMENALNSLSLYVPSVLQRLVTSPELSIPEIEDLLAASGPDSPGS